MQVIIYRVSNVQLLHHNTIQHCLKGDLNRRLEFTVNILK